MTQRTAGEPSVRYDESTDTYRVTHEWWGDRSFTTAIVTAASEVTDTPPADLDPIQRVIDADALDELYAPLRIAEPRRSRSALTFQFESCDITVRSSGDIEIQPLADDGDGRDWKERWRKPVRPHLARRSPSKRRFTGDSSRSKHGGVVPPKSVRRVATVEYNRSR